MKIILLIVIFLVSCTQSPATMGVRNDNIPQYKKILVIGENGKHGMFDPSVAYGKNGTGWLVYSSVNAPVVNTNLAVSKNGGRTWTFVKALNKPAEDSVTYKGRKIKGFWVHETPSLVHDPEDKGREWKLFWHKYFYKAPYKPKDHIWTYGGIAYKYASHPRGSWSEEKMLLVMETYRTFYDKRARILKGLDQSLKKFALFYEPGVIVEDGVIFLSLDASVSETGLGAWSKRKIVLISSPNHGKTWEFVNNLTDSRDARKLGYLAFSASSIVREKGRLFLFVAPAGSLKGKNKAHNGTYILEFEDISRGLLERNAQSELIVHKFIQIGLSQDEPNDYHERTQGGPSDYDENNSYGGIIFPQRNPKWATGVFRLYNTRINVVD